MASKQKNKKPWGGRFSRGTDSFVEKFTESVSFDHRLYRHDIMGSIAHAKMLVHVKVLTAADGKKIIDGLKAIEKSIEAGRFTWRQELEDVHMNIEAALVRKIGNTGKKLHTGRSRNDQVATDLRLYLRDQSDGLADRLRAVMLALCDLAEQEAASIMPGFTHLQIAQPVTFGHHMMAWYEMLKRDLERLKDCRKRINALPLGAAALAGTGYPLDRVYTAKLLGFDQVAANSMDAVSDRDFIIEFCAWAAMTMMHLSRFSEELILWMNPLYGFIDLDDAWCTGSSIMPQKKNPDVPELVRGKTARVYGDLMAMLTLMKAQPLAYNRDNQEDKVALFDTVDTLQDCLEAYAGIIPAISVRPEVMEQAARQGYATATDLADYLVRKGVPFRDAHEAVGKSVNYAISKDKDLAELSLKELSRFCPNLNEDVYACLEPGGSVKSRNYTGGTSPSQVKKAARAGRKYVNLK